MSNIIKKNLTATIDTDHAKMSLNMQGFDTKRMSDEEIANAVLELLSAYGADFRSPEENPVQTAKGTWLCEYRKPGESKYQSFTASDIGTIVKRLGQNTDLLNAEKADAVEWSETAKCGDQYAGTFFRLTLKNSTDADFESVVPQALSVANAILRMPRPAGDEITGLKIQGLLYFIQKYSLEEYGRPAFADDIEAWRIGPVVRDVYNETRKYCGFPIFGTIKSTNPSDEPISDSTQCIIDSVLYRYGTVEPWELMNMAKKDGDWRQYYIEGSERRVIPMAAKK